MYQRSTIRPKLGICPLCPPGSKQKPLIAGKCESHYWEQNKKKSFEKAQAKVMGELEPVKILIDDLDIIFSQLIRLSHADEHGMVQCFTCDIIRHWKQMQCGHFVSRAQMPTRFSVKNCRPQCKDCNEHKDGNLIVFSERLEAEEPGIVAILEEQSRGIQDYSRDELKALIADTTRKVKLLMNNIYQ
jgi:hypothetical protein